MHIIENKEKYTKEQLMLMKTQDINYVNFKRSVERKVSMRLTSLLLVVVHSGILAMLNKQGPQTLS